MPEANEEVLQRWQARLLELLRAGGDPAAIRSTLLADPELAPLHAYAAGLDLHALAVAVELVAKWAPAPVSRGSSPAGTPS
jgi:hypothetical protein